MLTFRRKPAGHVARLTFGALNKGDDASVNSISCVAPGECAATGNFAPQPLTEGSFVVSETNGRWGKAKVIAIPPHRL